jgi:hypothetical protein
MSDTHTIASPGTDAAHRFTAFGTDIPWDKLTPWEAIECLDTLGTYLRHHPNDASVDTEMTRVLEFIGDADDKSGAPVTHPLDTHVLWGRRVEQSTWTKLGEYKNADSAKRAERKRRNPAHVYVVRSVSEGAPE